MPKEKQPSQELIWNGTSEEISSWIEDVMKPNYNPNVEFDINDVEGD
jgi:hypothetical protein